MVGSAARACHRSIYRYTPASVTAAGEGMPSPQTSARCHPPPVIAHGRARSTAFVLRSRDESLALEQRRDQAVLEERARGARDAAAAGDLGHGHGLEGSVDDEARVALLVAGVVAVVVDPMAVVG